ncbi:MAG TPA: hypothetical protein VKM55_06850 [Candidatus Lokiarchaeia archaeon]|nr:hypothetical protein [Candidatus Lokiarchaeia archaeon]
MVNIKLVKLIILTSIIIIAFGFLIMMLLLSGLNSSGGIGLMLSALGFFNTGLNMELVFLIFPAVILFLLLTKTVKIETTLHVTRMLSFLAMLLIVFYLIFVFLGVIAPQLNPYNHAFVDVMLIFIVMFAIEGFLYFIVFLIASKAIARGTTNP